MIKQKYAVVSDIQRAMDDSKLIVNKTTEYLQKKLNSTVLKMGWEKTYKGMILLKKKKYVGLKYEENGKPPKIDSKGLDDVRRETTKMTKDLILKLYKLIFIDNDIEQCRTLIKEKISSLLQRKVNIYELMSSKKLKSEEMYKTPQLHTNLNKKLKERGSEGYRPGDRVLYVVIAGAAFKSKKINKKGKPTSSKDKMFEKGEDPLYAHQTQLILDIDYYMENQIKKPLIRIFSHVIKNIEKLFEGEHTRHKVNVTPKIFELSKFAIKIEKCLCCKEPLKKKSEDMEDMFNQPICSSCEKKGLLKLKYDEISNKKKEITEKENECLEECYKCQNFRGDVLCSNVNACANFWVKEDVFKNLNEINELMSKFKIKE